MTRKAFHGTSTAVFIAFAVMDLFVWYQIIFHAPPASAELYFLDVGQGDSTLLVFPGGVKVLTDAGPDKSALFELQEVLPSSDRYIDLAVITHPERDHFGGFNDIIGRYEVGAFIVSGRSRDDGDAAWNALIAAIEARHIPLVVVGRGDRILHGESEIAILSPDVVWRESAALNDTSIVARVNTGDYSLLLTADIGMNVEDELLLDNLRADILKVGHHGSKYSSGEAFLSAVALKLAVISSGENNYGHPSPEALQRLIASGAHIFRTDTNGRVKVLVRGGKLQVFSEKE